MSHKCRDCDDANPHPWIAGQRRLRCWACGYRSHWFRAAFRHEYKLAVVNNGFLSDWTDGEYDVSSWCEGWKDGREVRLSLCCYAPAGAGAGAIAQSRPRRREHVPDRTEREERLVDVGWQAYAREEGHYDDGSDR